MIEPVIVIITSLLSAAVSLLAAFLGLRNARAVQRAEQELVVELDHVPAEERDTLVKLTYALRANPDDTGSLEAARAIILTHLKQLPLRIRERVGVSQICLTETRLPVPRR